MPSLSQIEYVANVAAAPLDRNISYDELKLVVNDIINNPLDYGGKKHWDGRANWNIRTLETYISRIMWGTPIHPSKIFRGYKYLPFKMLEMIYQHSIPNLTFGLFTNKEHHEYLMACSTNREFGGNEWRVWINHPLVWMCRHLTFIQDYRPRTRLIAEWLINKKGWKGWREGIEVGYGANGEMIKVNVVAMLDEIGDEDLTSGKKTNPEKVFRALLEKKGEENLKRIRELNEPLPIMPWKEIEGVIQIKTGAELEAEGRRMGHCVGLYIERCKKRTCYILRLPESTAEILPSGEVYQHRGMHNSVPPKRDIKLLEEWCKQIPKRQDSLLPIAEWTQEYWIQI